MTKFIILLFVVYSHSFASQGQFNYEVNLVAGYDGDDDIYSVPGQRLGIGFEYFRVLSGEYGDIAKVNIQTRLTTNPNGNYDSPYILTPFYGNDEMKRPANWLELHAANIQFKLNQGRSDIWLGHQDVPFGLEPNMDTHSSLTQSFAMDSVGFKKDWGTGVVGRFNHWDYAAAVTVGSGMPLSFNDNYCGAARIGILDPDYSNMAFGVSALYGDLLPTMGLAVMSNEPNEKILGGSDITLKYGRYSLLAEGVYGTNGDNRIGGGWLRGTVEVPDWRWFTATGYGSILYDDIGSGEPTYKGGGELNFKYNAAIKLAAGCLITNKDSETEYVALIQIYYFYPTLSQWLPSGGN